MLESVQNYYGKVLENLEPASEDYGKAVTYRGTIAAAAARYRTMSKQGRQRVAPAARKIQA